jgi:dimeric dUTPase (all-alpha-NTP-PPase superfamily)
MDLTKLFETQKILRDRINYNEPDRFNKLILSLLVELGECANEWRGFKFWSKDQDPRTTFKCKKCDGNGYIEWFSGSFENNDLQQEMCSCDECGGIGEIKEINPLLEEYADCLHFILEIGLELLERKFITYLPDKAEAVHKWIKLETTDQFKQIIWVALKVEIAVSNQPEHVFLEYGCLFSDYLALGEKLGFTEEQIIEAYYVKNQINHQRQEEGY